MDFFGPFPTKCWNPDLKWRERFAILSVAGLRDEHCHWLTRWPLRIVKHPFIPRLLTSFSYYFIWWKMSSLFPRPSHIHPLRQDAGAKMTSTTIQQRQQKIIILRVFWKCSGSKVKMSPPPHSAHEEHLFQPTGGRAEEEFAERVFSRRRLFISSAAE